MSDRKVSYRSRTVDALVRTGERKHARYALKLT